MSASIVCSISFSCIVVPQELRAVSLVGDQLSGFAADMERDSKAQRLELSAAADAVVRC